MLWCEPSKLQKEAYEEILRAGVTKVDELEGGRARMQMLTVLLRLRQASCDLRLLAFLCVGACLESLRFFCVFAAGFDETFLVP